MSVAFIVNDFPLLSETFVINQAIGLIDRGHKVDIYTVNSNQPQSADIQHQDVENYRLCDRTHRRASIPRDRWLRMIKALVLLALNAHKNPRFCWRWFKAALLGEGHNVWRLLYQALPLLGESHDIVHCQFGTTGLIGASLQRFGAVRGKLITTFRGYDISQYVRNHGDHVYDELFRSGTLFLTNCAFFERRLMKLGCDRCKLMVLPSGIDCAKFERPRQDERPENSLRLVTIGRLVEKKGIEYGIRAIAKFAATRPDIAVEYMIVGDGPLREPLQELVAELGVAERVKMLSWRNHHQIISILGSADVFLGPSVTADDGNQDAPINTLKEAMALELPVVATWHGGIPELVQDEVSGFLVPERDADAIADKLLYLVDHREEWQQLGSAGRRYVNAHYHLDSLNDELVTIYRKALA